MALAQWTSYRPVHYWTRPWLPSVHIPQQSTNLSFQKSQKTNYFNISRLEAYPVNLEMVIRSVLFVYKKLVLLYWSAIKLYSVLCGRIPTAGAYSTVCGLAMLYFCDWKAVLQYVPLWNGKYLHEPPRWSLSLKCSLYTGVFSASWILPPVVHYCSTSGSGPVQALGAVK